MKSLYNNDNHTHDMQNWHNVTTRLSNEEMVNVNRAIRLYNVANRVDTIHAHANLNIAVSQLTEREFFEYAFRTTHK